MDEKEEELKLLYEGFLRYLYEGGEEGLYLNDEGEVADREDIKQRVFDEMLQMDKERLSRIHNDNVEEEDFEDDIINVDDEECPEFAISNDMMEVLSSLGSTQIEMLYKMILKKEGYDVEVFEDEQPNELDTEDRKIFLLIKEYLKHKRVVSCPSCNTLLAVAGYGKYECKCGIKFTIARII